MVVVLLIVVAVVMEVTVVDILPPVTHPSTRHPSIQTLPPALPHVVIFSLKVKVTLICLYSSYQYSRIPFLLFIFLFFLISSLIFSTLPSFFSFIPLGPSGLDVLPFFTLTSERYRHTLARLEHQLLDAASCHQDMNAIIQLKAVRTEVVLSLFATVFLPMTFLTGTYKLTYSFGINVRFLLSNPFDILNPLFLLPLCLLPRRVWDEFFFDSPCLHPYYILIPLPHYSIVRPGVFGMNFEAGAGYSIPLLNDPNGPNVFISMCIGKIRTYKSQYLLTHIYYRIKYPSHILLLVLICC